jgi:anaerobic selenocysteine-containing dehydrogenase
MDRRSFIKLTAITGTSATLASCGNPEHQLIRFVPDEDIIPGVATWKPSVCPLCQAGCGLTVRVMDADADVVRNGQAGIVRIAAAKKLEGAPDHPVNRGGLCARGQSAIQITYHPDRITQPLKRSGDRGQGRYEAITWENALAEHYRTRFAKLGVVRRGAARAFARDVVERFDVRAGAGIDTQARALSGGNMQKLILGRALAAEGCGHPSAQLARESRVQPAHTPGLDGVSGQRRLPEAEDGARGV